MYPYERSLVKRMKGKPFTLLGINTDPKPRAKQVIERERMTWPTYWDANTGGPISRQWVVRGWPAFHLIDHKGMIRGKYINGAEMHLQAEQLIKEMEAEKRAAK